MGGLGINATMHFLNRVVRKTEDLYGDGAEHFPQVLEINPSVPCLSHAILQGDHDECGSMLGNMARNLSKANAEFIICFNNTAHAFEKEI